MPTCPTERSRRDDQHAHTGHSHGASRDADTRYLTIALGLIVAFMVVEVVVAVVSGSLALLADAGHMLTDVGALARLSHAEDKLAAARKIATVDVEIA